MEFKRVNNDINGNPRFVVHFLYLLNEGESQGLGVLESFDLALKKARKVGGTKYRGRDFGGGIVFQSYNIIETINKAKGGI
jgi:hypothetical protein